MIEEVKIQVDKLSVSELETVDFLISQLKELKEKPKVSEDSLRLVLGVQKDIGILVDTFFTKIVASLKQQNILT